MCTLCHIIFKCTLQLLHGSFTVNDRVHLKIKSETADIHIGRSHTCYHAVHAHSLCMQETVIIYITLRSGGNHVSHIGISGPIDKRMIRFARYHDPHIDPGPAGDLKRVED